jgi:hypothetical protein
MSLFEVEHCGDRGVNPPDAMLSIGREGLREPEEVLA